MCFILHFNCNKFHFVIYFCSVFHSSEGLSRAYRCRVVLSLFLSFFFGENGTFSVSERGVWRRKQRERTKTPSSSWMRRRSRPHHYITFLPFFSRFLSLLLLHPHRRTTVRHFNVNTTRENSSLNRTEKFFLGNVSCLFSSSASETVALTLFKVKADRKIISNDRK